MANLASLFVVAALRGFALVGGVLAKIPIISHLGVCLLGRAGPSRVDHRSTDNQVAIVLVHGFSGGADTTWDGFVKLLLAEVKLLTWDLYSIGYPSNLRVDVPSVWAADPDLDVLAKALRTHLSLPPFARYRQIALVAHSMGGLVVQRAILDDPLLIDRLSHVLLFGTPSGGLAKARLFAALKRQIRDMASDGNFIKKLRQDWSKRFLQDPPFIFRVAAGDRDEFVPASSSLAPFQDRIVAVVPGNHLEIVGPTDSNHQSYSLLVQMLNGTLGLPGTIDSARIAVERGDFRAAVERLLPMAVSLDEVALVSLALALDGLGRGAEALEALEQYGRQMRSTDALGTLAGRIKRRWLNERSVADFNRARELYSEGLARAEADNDHDQAFYHGINVAFLDLMSSPPNSKVPDSVKTMIGRVRSHLENVMETRWSLATKGEACLMMGEIETAESLYSRAIEMSGSPREIYSMYSHAIRIAVRVLEGNGSARVERLFGVANNA